MKNKEERIVGKKASHGGSSASNSNKTSRHEHKDNKSKNVPKRVKKKNLWSKTIDDDQYYSRYCSHIYICHHYSTRRRVYSNNTCYRSNAYTRQAPARHIRGKNGAVELSVRGVGDSRVALFFALVRDCPNARVKELMQLVMKDATPNKPESIVDLFVMAFQTRNCRGGKGERDLFYVMIMEMARTYPETTKSLMSLVPHYGSFKDWFNLIDLASSDVNPMDPIVDCIYDLARDQLLKDAKTLERMTAQESSSSLSSKAATSLLAKWAPREKKRFDKQAKVLAKMLFPQSKVPRKEYRQLLARLNQSLDTPEIAMSANEWHNIDFTKVPSVSLFKYRRAFMNEMVKGPLQGSEKESDTGNRHPNNLCRVECRRKLKIALLQQQNDCTQGKLKGRQLYPHTIAEKIINQHFSYNSGGLSEMEEHLFACQWQDIRSSVVSGMEKVREIDLNNSTDGKNSPAINLGQIVPLVDVSGSMCGTPLDVAISLGILVSEIASPAYANRCLTFSAVPEWVKLDANMTLVKKVEKMRNAPWGMNTNFEAATEKILDVAVKAKLKPHEIPKALLVLSDMQFDEAREYGRRGSWETHHERIVRRFKSFGCAAPHIIYWNLRGNTVGFPVQANTPDVILVSGFSPSAMKLLMDGEALKEDGKKERNPYTTLRKALDDETYDVVRKVLSVSQEGALASYEAQ